MPMGNCSRMVRLNSWY